MLRQGEVCEYWNLAVKVGQSPHYSPERVWVAATQLSTFLNPLADSGRVPKTPLVGPF
jgi:hypothetical protein